MAAILIVLAMIVTFVRTHSGSFYDDAFIYFRYAESLASGCGFRFNCQDPVPVEGFTSPLYLGLLTLGRLASAPLDTVAVWSGGAGVAAAALLAQLACSRYAQDSGSLPGLFALVLGTSLVLGLDHYFLLNAVIGLETAIACAAIGALFLSASSRDTPLLRTALAVAVLARPEAAAFFPALLLFPKARTLRYLAPLAGFCVAMIAARALIFHDVLPNTVWAKSGGTWAHARLGVAYLIEFCRDFPLVLAAPAALIPRATRRPASFFLTGSGLWLAALVPAGGDHFSYGRLAVPLLAPLSVLGLVGVHAAMGACLRRKPRAGSVLGIAAMCVVASIVALRARRDHAFPPQHGFPNVLRWEAVGRYLRAHHAGATIATVPVGAIAWFSGARTLDLAGLTNREVGRLGERVPSEMLIRNWIGHERHNSPWVWGQRPEIIVMSKFRDRPWTDVRDTRAGFFSEWLLLRAIKEGQTPYELYSPEVAPGLYWLMFRRSDSTATR